MPHSEYVDYIFNGKELKLDQVKEIANLDALWCSDCKAPNFIVKKIDIESCKISYKREGICYVASFVYEGVTYKKKFCSREVYEEMTRQADLKFGRSHAISLTVLCEFCKEENGFSYVSIKDFNSVKSNKIVF